MENKKGHCGIGSCPMVSDGAPCYREGCQQWVLDEEPKEETLLGNLKSKYNAGYSKSDVEGLIDTVYDEITTARDLIENGDYGKASHKLDCLLSELEEME